MDYFLVDRSWRRRDKNIWSRRTKSIVKAVTVVRRGSVILEPCKLNRRDLEKESSDNTGLGRRKSLNEK